MQPVPFNRHLLVKKQTPLQQEESLILLPEGSKKSSAFTTVKVLCASEDCRGTWTHGSKVVVPTHMIESLSCDGSEYHLVSESHILLGFTA